ncbi:MAG: PPK2 family polyphosphate kinase [Bacteroidia bacterium]|jgi:PPK2 family polyphosphate:nucleotide phosphotransferase
MNTSKYCITQGTSFKLKDYKTIATSDAREKEDLKEILQKDIEEIQKLQQLFFANQRHSILLIFQAMDAAGKDGAIKNIATGINPQGCEVFSFKPPTEQEYKHDFLWRHYIAAPEKGKFGIHNRSHYEFVLACKVNPEFILNENMPGIFNVSDITKDFWKERYQRISSFESQLVDTGTIVLKFFLNISKEEQKKRLLERINDPNKNWKFQLGDLKTRSQWDLYMKAYEEAIQNTSQKKSPWYVIPADDKWYARSIIARVLKETLLQLNLQYPKLNSDSAALLEEAKKILAAS